MSKDIHRTTQRKLNLPQTIKTVLWGLFGVRKGAGYENDIARVNPIYLIITALVATLFFVVGLVMVAKFFINQAV